MRRLPYLLGATGLSLALFTVSCTTLGGHVKGGFACKAPVGTCAPMSNIDAEAIAGLGAGDGAEHPISGSGQGRDSNVIFASGDGVPARTGERTMKVVFPAHSDANGVYHEEAIAHVVAEGSRWTLRSAQAPASGSLDAAIVRDAPTSQPDSTPIAIGPTDPISNAPQSLREVAAGLSAPADPTPDAPREQVAVDVPASGAGAPSPAALAAARAGHRIGQAIAPQDIVAHGGAHGHRRSRSPSKPAATVPGAATAALNRASLEKAIATSRIAHVSAPVGPEARPRLVATASLPADQHGNQP